MPRNILCLIICAFLCFSLSGCASSEEPESERPSVSTTLGQSPAIDLTVGDIESISFRVDINRSIYQGNFTVSISDTDIVDVSYSSISGNYIYYNITAKEKGTATIYLDMPAQNVRSEIITVRVDEAAPDEIYSSLGENPIISIVNGSKKVICFHISEDVPLQHVLVVPSEEGFADITFYKRSGAYFYYTVSALKKGTFNLQAKIGDTDIKSEVITVSIVAKDELPENEEISNGFVCNTSTKMFHLPTCGNAKNIKDENKVVYSDISFRQELLDAGYVPCLNCNP